MFARVVHSRQCLNGDGQEVPCCQWSPDTWVPPYMSLASVMLLWTVFLFGQFRIFTISGTVAQWWDPLSRCPVPVHSGAVSNAEVYSSNFLC